MTNTESTRYTIVFAAIVCVVCALVVATSAVGLRSLQEANQLVFRQKNVLLAAGLVKPGDTLTDADVRQRFDRDITVRLIELATGEYVTDGRIDAKSYDQRRARSDPALSRAAPPNGAKVARLPTYAAIYLVGAAGKDDGFEQVVLPIEGIGMWGTLYGFLALDRDGRTVRGLTFYDQKETPGLGGEIASPRWQALWAGRQAFDANWEPKLTMIKGNAGPPAQDPHRVDAISGATITSNGVAKLVSFWLSPDGYGRYLKRIREGSGK